MRLVLLLDDIDTAALTISTSASPSDCITSQPLSFMRCETRLIRDCLFSTFERKSSFFPTNFVLLAMFTLLLVQNSRNWKSKCNLLETVSKYCIIGRSVNAVAVDSLELG